MTTRPHNSTDVRLYRLVMWLSIALAFVSACNLYSVVSIWTHSLRTAAAIKTTQGVVILHTEQIRELRDRVQGVEFISTEADEPPDERGPVKINCWACGGSGQMREEKDGKLVDCECPGCNGTGRNETHGESETIYASLSEDKGLWFAVERVDGTRYVYWFGNSPPENAKPEAPDPESLGEWSKSKSVTEAMGRIFDGHRIRNRPKPIQKITTNIKDTSANGATMTRNVAIGVGLGCIGVPLFLIALAVLAGRGRR